MTLFGMFNFSSTDPDYAMDALDNATSHSDGPDPLSAVQFVPTRKNFATSQTDGLVTADVPSSSQDDPESISSPGVMSSLAGNHIPPAMDSTNPNSWLVPPVRSRGDAFGEPTVPYTAKVLVKEVDHSSAMREGMYSLKSRLHKITGQVLELKSQKESDTLRMRSLQRDHDESLHQLRIERQGQIAAELLERDEMIAQQANAIKNLQQQSAQQIAEREAQIAQQVQALEKLKEELSLATEQSAAAVRAQLSQQMEQFAAEKESELIALKKKNDSIWQQLQTQQQQKHSGPSSQTSPTHHSPRTEFPSGLSSPATHVMTEHNIEAVAAQVYALLQNKLPSSVNPPRTPPTPTPMPRRSRVSRKIQQLKYEIDMDKERNSNLEHVRDLFTEVFTVQQDEDFLLASCPSQDEVKDFAMTGSDGPDPHDLRWDFDHPASSQWNQVVISLLLTRLAEMRNEKKWTTAPKSNEYWVEAISQKFNRIRTQISKAKPRVLDGNTLETTQGVASRLVKAKEQSLKKARRDARRIAKYNRRVQVTQAACQLREEQGEHEDARSWGFLSNMLTTLGNDGMSSDESGEDDREPIFLTKIMLWRRDIMRELKIIDTSRSQESLLSPRGAKGAKRVRSTIVSSRKPVKDLPQQFYSPTWLVDNCNVAAEDTFQWMEILTQKV